MKRQAAISRFFKPLDIETVPIHNKDGKQLLTTAEKKESDAKALRDEKSKTAWWNVQYETRGKLVSRIKQNYIWQEYSSLQPLGQFQPSRPTFAHTTDIKFDKTGALFAVASSDGHIEVHDFDNFMVAGSYSPPPLPATDGSTNSYRQNTIYDDLSRQPVRILSDASKQLPPLFPPIVQLNCGQTLSCIQWNIENQNELICSFSSFKDVYAYDLETCGNTATRTFKSRTGSSIFDLAFVPDRKQMIGVGRDCSLQFWDTRTTSSTTTLTARYKRKKQSPHNLLPKRIIAEKKGNGSFNSIQVRSDGNIVYVGTDRGYINVWDIRYTSTVMSTLDIGMLMTKAGFGPKDAASGVSSIALDPSDGYMLGFQLFNSVLGVLDTSTGEGRMVSLYRPPAVKGEEGFELSSAHLSRLHFTATNSFLCAGGGAVGGGQGVLVADMKSLGLECMEKLTTMELLEKKYDKQTATSIAASMGVQFMKEQQEKEKEKKEQEENEMRERSDKHVVRVDLDGRVTSLACHPNQHYLVVGMQGNEIVVIGPPSPGGDEDNRMVF